MTSCSLSDIFAQGAQHSLQGPGAAAARGPPGWPLLAWDHSINSRGKNSVGFNVLITPFPRSSPYSANGGWAKQGSPYLLTILAKTKPQQLVARGVGNMEFLLLPGREPSTGCWVGGHCCLE